MASKARPCHTILDRSIVPVLPSMETASFRDGIDPQQERIHRLHGTSLIYDATLRILQVSSSVYATACTIFHRYCHNTSLRDKDVWSTAMASVLLACKLEECSGITIKQVILAFVHIYQQRRLIMVSDPELCQRILSHNMAVAESSVFVTGKSLAEKHRLLQQQQHRVTLSKFGPTWKEWHTAVTTAENDILRQLGFTLHWIPDQHPHRFVIYFLRVLELLDDDDNSTNDLKNNQQTREHGGNKSFAQTCWTYCNDVCRLPAGLQFESHVIACAVIHVAALERKQRLLPDLWWRVFCGNGHDEQLSVIANAILALLQGGSDKDGDDPFQNVVASHGMIKSLLRNGSFNDPQSFLWDVHSPLIDE